MMQTGSVWFHVPDPLASHSGEQASEHNGELQEYFLPALRQSISATATASPVPRDIHPEPI